MFIYRKLRKLYISLIQITVSWSDEGSSISILCLFFFSVGTFHDDNHFQCKDGNVFHVLTIFVCEYFFYRRFLLDAVTVKYHINVLLVPYITLHLSNIRFFFYAVFYERFLCQMCKSVRTPFVKTDFSSFFIPHKKDIIFAWPCRYSTINLDSLTRVATNSNTKLTSAVFFLSFSFSNFNFIQFSVFSVRRWRYAMLMNLYKMVHCTYITFRTHAHPLFAAKFQFYFVFYIGRSPESSLSQNCRLFFNFCAPILLIQL